jgi:hypothetical protein
MRLQWTIIVDRAMGGRGGEGGEGREGIKNVCMHAFSEGRGGEGQTTEKEVNYSHANSIKI